MADARDLTVPNILVIDVETSGLYRDDLPMDDEGQPWAMQIAAGLWNSAGVGTQYFSHIIKSEGRRTKDNALKVHGISDRATAQIGISQNRVLGVLTDMLKTASMTEMKVVTYGDLDRRVIASLLARYAVFLGKPSHAHDLLWFSRPGVQFIDLQKPYLQQLCKLPSGFDDGSFKWPTMDEAADIVLGRKPRDGFHDAFDDMILLKDLYFECARRGLISDSPP